MCSHRCHMETRVFEERIFCDKIFCFDERKLDDQRWKFDSSSHGDRSIRWRQKLHLQECC